MTLRPILLAALVAAVLLPLPALALEKPLPADGKAIWSHLKASDYQKTFAIWPGTKEFARSKSEHGPLTTTRINRTGLDTLNGKGSEMSPGSLIVKENFDDGKALKSITVMYKARSYNPAAGNWFWAKYAPSGEIQLEGRVKPCIGCHQEKKENDYLLTAPLK